MIKYLKQSKEFEGGSAIWFTHYDILDILNELGNDLKNVHFYFMRYQSLIPRDYDQYESLIQIRGKKYDNSITTVDATLLYGSIHSDQVLYHILRDEYVSITSDFTFNDDSFEKHCSKVINEKILKYYNNHFRSFSFTIDEKDYLNVNSKVVFMTKKHK